MTRGPVVERFALALGSQPIAGLRAGAGNPRGVVLAIPGGGYDARYWHAGDGSDTSLLSPGAMLGYDMVAVDRPGYGGSRGASPEGYDLDEQVDLLFATIEALAPAGRPVFLIGHSMGGILAVRMAADPRGGRLAGIDVSGVPLRYPPHMLEGFRLARETGIAMEVDKAGLRQLFYGPDGTFDPALGGRLDGACPVPPREMAKTIANPELLPPLMARVTLPVRWVCAEYEASSIMGEAMLGDIRAMMPRCRRLVAEMQVGSGHNISLHHVARAYHLKALAFFEECRQGGA